MARIDRLSPVDRRVLRCAAVVGARFQPELVEAALEEDVGDEDVWSRLEEFLDKEDGALRFRHALVRDAAYEGLPYRRRRELHERVGETIERAAATPEDEAELLSLHFFHAHEFAKAWRYSRVAGERAQAIYANVEAAAFFERALGGRSPPPRHRRRGPRGGAGGAGRRPREAGRVREGGARLPRVSDIARALIHWTRSAGHHEGGAGSLVAGQATRRRSAASPAALGVLDGRRRHGRRGRASAGFTRCTRLFARDRDACRTRSSGLCSPSRRRRPPTPVTRSRTPTSCSTGPMRRSDGTRRRSTRPWL